MPSAAVAQKLLGLLERLDSHLGGPAEAAFRQGTVSPRERHASSIARKLGPEKNKKKWRKRTHAHRRRGARQQPNTTHT